MRVVLAEYYVTDDRILLFLGRSDFPEPQVVVIERSRPDLRSFMARSYTADDGIGIEADMELWQEFLGPLVEPLLAVADPGDLLWFVPHDVLHYVPMHALSLDGVPLIDRYPVCYAPSSSVMRYCQGKRKGSRRTALVMGDSRGDLPYAREEALSVGDLFAAEPHLGPDATKSLFLRDLDQKDIDVVHVACHGSFDARDPLASRILLHGESNLTALEIFGLRFRADLVTLSACQTAVNERRPGDELIGLTRALIFAGTPSAVVSLWAVDDMSTGFLMRAFYRRLLDSAQVSKAQALREAQRELRHASVQILLGDCDRRLATAADEDRRSWLRLERADILTAGFDFQTACGAYEEELARTETAYPGADRPPVDRLRRTLKILRFQARHAPVRPDPDRRPFEHPYYWAPFLLVGDWK
jgi:CHAT domain-containing protein